MTTAKGIQPPASTLVCNSPTSDSVGGGCSVGTNGVLVMTVVPIVVFRKGPVVVLRNVVVETGTVVFVIGIVLMVVTFEVFAGTVV